MAKYYPTLKDVAKQAGVSVSTVSRVSLQHPDVSEETKKKVLDAMRSLGYRPSILAQGLVSGRSKSIGLLVSNITNPFYPQLVGGIEEEASEAGYVVFLCNTCEDPDRSRHYIDRLLRQGVDGIIHASVNDDDDALQSLIDHYIPLVLVNRRTRELHGFDVVVFDSFGSAQKATRHLLSLGHRKIALITGPLYVSTEQDRLKGFKVEMESCKVPIQEEWIYHAQTSRENGYQIAIDLLSRTVRPTAFIANDIVTYGILDAAQDLSLEIPKDLSLIGLGLIEYGNLGRKQITSISSQISKMGKLGCRRLIDAIENKEHQPSETILEVELVDRGTTAPPSQ